MTPPSLSARRRNEQGWSLPSTLVAGAILSCAALLISSETLSIVRHMQSISLGDAAQQTSLSTLAATPLPPSGCDTVTSTHKTTILTRSRCVESAPPIESSPPAALPPMLVDFDTLFSRLATCPGTRRRMDALTFTAPTAPITCLMTSAATSSLVVLDNIHAATLTLAPQAKGETILIATPGSLTITDELTLSASALIFSGGDLSIKRLHSAVKSPIKVTILSMRGDLEVAEASGQLSLIALGRGKREVPPAPFTPPYPFPPLRQRTVYGLEARSSH